MLETLVRSNELRIERLAQAAEPAVALARHAVVTQRRYVVSVQESSVDNRDVGRHRRDDEDKVERKPASEQRRAGEAGDADPRSPDDKDDAPTGRAEIEPVRIDIRV